MRVGNISKRGGRRYSIALSERFTLKHLKIREGANPYFYIDTTNLLYCRGSNVERFNLMAKLGYTLTSLGL